MSIIGEKLVEVGIVKSDQEANLHVLQRLSSDYALAKKLLQYAPSLTLTHIEHRVRTARRELEEIRKVVDGSAYVLIATGGPGIFPAPGHHYRRLGWSRQGWYWAPTATRPRLGS